MRKLLIGLVLFISPAFGAYNYYRSITIDHTKCGSSDSSSFPVLVSISDTTIKTVANGGHIQHTATQGAPAVTMPADLIFATTSAGSTLLPWEVEFYDPVNGVLVAWVQLPTVSHTANTIFYVLYGNASVSTAQNTGSYTPANVWDVNYVGVYHMGALGVLATDSTSYGNNGSITGATATTGKVGGGAAFSGTSQYINLANPASLRLIGGISIEAWVNPTDRSSYFGVVSKTDSNLPASWDFYLDTSTGIPDFSRDDGSSSPAKLQGTSAPATGSWSHVVATMVGGVGTVATHYLNGGANGSATLSPGGVADTGNNAYIATRDDKVTMFKGSMDEVRISNVARGADWVTTCFNSQNAPGNIGAANFLTYGAETSFAVAIRHRVIAGKE